MKPAGGALASPRTNLNARLRQALPDLPPHVALPASAIDAAIGVLLPADAENKLNARKLYLVLDLDETLVYAHKLEPGASPVGTLIHVRGTPYDLVKRPGLKFFMEMAHKNFVVSLYTMGDADYAQAVLRVIDPEGKYFRGGACCWRPSESRLHKSLARVVCDRRMALIVDDSVDVWGGDLGNLCLTRRFVGDKLDDGLQLLSWQLSQAHAAFYANAPAEGYSLEAPSGSPRAPPTIFSVLGQARGSLLAGCKVCLTGIVTDLSEETLEGVPLGGLIQQFGGEMVLNVEHATHLVARRKDGWKASPKIRKAFARQQEGSGDFFAVWDHWLLDTLTSWQRQSEASYAIDANEDEADGAPAAAPLLGGVFGPARMGGESADDIVDPASDGAMGDMPPRKRARPDVPAALGVNGAAPQALLADAS